MGTQYGHPPNRVTEKEITLKLAKAAEEELKRAGISVTLTRVRDTELGLAERTAIANRLKADLFVSIHLNSLPPSRASSQTAQGVETYILNNTSDGSSRRLAELENSVLGGSSIQARGQIDVARILKDLTLDANLESSTHLACLLQSKLLVARNLFRTGNQSGQSFMNDGNRGVKQALFHVLLGADMPSALVEAGFLSHASDRKVLMTVKGQRAFGRAIAQAVLDFKRETMSDKAALTLSRCKVNGQGN